MTLSGIVLITSGCFLSTSFASASSPASQAWANRSASETALHQQTEYLLMAKLVGQHVRRPAPAKAENINMASTLRVLLGKIFLRDTHPRRGRILIEK